MRGGLGQRGGASVEQLEARLLRYHEEPPALDFEHVFADLNWQQDSAMTADGREMLLGDGDAAHAQYLLARYVADPNNPFGGLLDHTFGSGGSGYVLVNQTGGVPGKPRAVALLPDGRMLVLGQANDGRITFTRHLADGTIDASFGSGGTVAASSPALTSVLDLVIAPDGKLLVVGNVGGVAGVTGQRAMLVRRFNADGSPDATFGTGGVVIADFVGTIDEGGCAYVDDQGRIVVGGSTWLNGANGVAAPNIAILRLTDTGTPDTTFGANGQWIGNMGVEMPSATGFAETAFGFVPSVNELTRLFVGGIAAPKIVNGRLYVAGTSGPDDIRINQSGASIEVRINGAAYQFPIEQISGPVIVDSLAGDDLIELNFAMPGAWVWGGEGDDRIGGSNWGDLLLGGPGNDRLDGRGGDDTMHGGGGTDAFVGNEGRDWISGGIGNDRVASGPGTDFVFGGYGNDLIGGGAGSDYLYGGAGNDTLNGNGGGTDYVAGNEGTNVYAGQATVSAAAHVARASLFADLTRNDDDDEPEVLQSL